MEERRLGYFWFQKSQQNKNERFEYKQTEIRNKASNQKQ